MTKWGLTCFTAVATVGLCAQTVALSDEAVATAIAAGQSNKYKHLLSECTAKPSYGQSVSARMGGGILQTGKFDVMVSRAAGRIAFLVVDAKRLYRPFSAADVTPEMRKDDTLFLTVRPEDPTRDGNKSTVVAAPIEQVVIRGPGSVVVQPADVQLIPVEWSNLVGGKVQGNSATATFPLAAVRDLPAGDIDILVITSAGERRCKIGQGDRTRVLTAK